MAKHEDLEIVVPSLRRASYEGDQPAREQVDQGEDRQVEPPLGRKPDSTKALLIGPTEGFCALQVQRARQLRLLAAGRTR